MSEQTQESNKLIIEFEAAGYLIDEQGSVLGKTGLRLKLAVGKAGYLKVSTWVNSKQKTYSIHRLVASKYIANPLGLNEVNHIDGNKLNNAVSNLQWCTRSDNIRHGFETGLITPPWQGKTGRSHSRSKSIQQLGLNGVMITTFGSIREAGRVTGISSKTINDCLLHKLKTAGGYRWKYL